MGSWMQRPRFWLVLTPLVLGPPVANANGPRVSCEILENGRPASGTIVLLAGSREVADGACGKPLSIPSGADNAVLRLDGALDGPEQRAALAPNTPTLRADFATGLLEVRIQSQGRDTAGIAVIRKAGKQIGTLGSGVTAHLSTGSYEVVARYRTRERRFEEVEIKAGQRTALNAGFD